MDKPGTSSRSQRSPLKLPVSQIQKDKEAFLKQLQAFPHTFQLQKQLPHEKMERALSGLVWAISIGYRAERTASLEEARARNMVAFLLHCLGRSEEALQELDKVLKVEGQSNNLVTLADKAFILWETHKLSQARQQLQTLKDIQDDPESDFEYLVVRAKAELAFTYSRLGPDFHRRSLELFSEVIPHAREPEIWLWKFGHALTWQRILRADPDSSIFNPPACMIQEQRDLLTELLEIANTCTCRNTKAKAFAELAFILNMVWKVYKTREKFEERIGLDRNRCCEQAIRLDSEDHSVLVKCGRIFRYTRRTDESRELLEKAVSMRPSTTGYHHLGLTYKALATRAIYKDTNPVPGHTSPRGAKTLREFSHKGRSSLDDERTTEMPDPHAMPTRSPMQKITKSPAIKGVTTFSRDNEFVMEAMQCFEIAIDVSKGENARDMYDLALLYRGLGEYEQAKIYLLKMMNYRYTFYPTEEINVCEQLGLVIKELSKTEKDEQTKQQLMDDSKQWLLMALKAASEFYAKSLQKQIGEIWQSFSTLLEEMETCDDGVMHNLKKDHVEKAELFRLIHAHEESLEVLRRSPKENDDPEILAEFIRNFAGKEEYQQVFTYLNLLKCTVQRERVTELLGEDFERQIIIKAGRQALLSPPADDSPFAALNAFKKSFDDVYNVESMPDTTSSEGGEAAVNSNISGTSEGNGRVNPEPAANTSGNISGTSEGNGRVNPEPAASTSGNISGTSEGNGRVNQEPAASTSGNISGTSEGNGRVNQEPAASTSSNISGTSEGNGRVNPEPAASTSSNIRPVRRQWDVAILHEEESTEKADSLVRVLRDLCKLRVTSRHSEIKPGMLELDFSTVMDQSKVVLVVVETDDHNDEVLTRLTDIAAFYPSTVVLFTDGAEDKIPHVLKSHRKFLCDERLLDNSLNPREACTEDVADMVCQLMDFLTDTKNLK